MKRIDIKNASDEDLVSRFAEIGDKQFEAIEFGEISRFNRLFDEDVKIVEELKHRPGDHRRVLMTLYDHPNVQVRLNAAKSTLAVAPVAARQLIQAIAELEAISAGGRCGHVPMDT